ncbi:MAG: YncE family protein [Bacteroidales bacterium]|jgi:DNA-binding beta-propeller fold protein YncE|nr:YncE family protein [Bacteroidales bacterium]
MKKYLFPLFLPLLLTVSCREEAEIFDPETEQVAPSESGDNGVRQKITGFYLLNEGNMGSNKSTLDYFNCLTNEYHRNIYASANPSVPKELGDVGNDLKIYGSKLYAVINGSGKVEVMDRRTARRLGQINIPNCRCIRFHEGYAYVTSYAGEVRHDPEYEQTGCVEKVDTALLQVVDRCPTGFQPEELEIVEGKIYVANSGGYMAPDRESSVSVIDVATFTEIKRIEFAENLHRLRADTHGNLWVSSRGNYRDVHAQLHWIDLQTEAWGGSIDIPVADFWLDGDSLYFCYAGSYMGTDNYVVFGIVDTVRKEVVTRNFITDGTDRRINIPYGIMVHPQTKDIYLTDANGYVSPGILYRFNRNGEQQWNTRTGDIPAHFALLWE